MNVDWNALFSLSVPLAELLVRGSEMYWFLFLVFRCVVRRELGGIGVGDILIMVIVADASQNALSGSYQSITDGFVLVGTLIGWNLLLNWLGFRFPFWRPLVRGRSVQLVRGGRVLWHHMAREFISEDELMVKLREHGIESLERVKDVYVESDGQLSVIPKEGTG